jgi:hypothetical protein
MGQCDPALVPTIGKAAEFARPMLVRLGQAIERITDGKRRHRK